MLSEAIHVACALAAGLIPLAVFALLSYEDALRRAQTELAETVEVARELAQMILKEAELELTRFVQVTGAQLTPEADKLLRGIVYTNPFFREAGIIDEHGFLVFSTAAAIKAPIEIPRSQRSDPGIASMQIVGVLQSALMQEKSIDLALPTRGQGEVNLLVDPGLLPLFFHGADLGPGGYLVLAGPKGRPLSVLGPAPEPGDLAAATAGPDRIRVTRSIDDRQVRVIGELDRAWALRDWYADLRFAIPLAGLASLALAWITIRLTRREQGLGHDLRRGIAKDELALEYQPIIELDNGQCVAAEALLRWHHPMHGYVRPDVFIPLAEETGLIESLTEWVVRRVMLEQGPLLSRFPGLRLSINCASSLLVSGGLERILRRVIVAPRMAASVVFELTEQVFVGQGADAVREAMTRLRRAGFSFALDDFGAGYSSVGYLDKFEFEYLKIDRSFVQAIGASDAGTSIFDTLVELAGKLNMVAVAEGVETEAQRRHVDQRGVPLAQGWLFATSLPIGEFEAFVAQAATRNSWPPGRPVSAADQRRSL
jgi:c-di-GMP phosphodiesterase